MQKFLGNYLGLVVDDQDPEQRGRVQVYVPHIMPTLFEGLNKENQTITFSAVGDNLANGLTADMLFRLREILPWAEGAMPIIGSGAQGVINPDGTFTPNSDNPPTSDSGPPSAPVNTSSAPAATPPATASTNLPKNTDDEKKYQVIKGLASKYGSKNPEITAAIAMWESGGSVSGETFGVNPEGISSGALHYAMRIAAAESGATGARGSTNQVNKIKSLDYLIAMSLGNRNGLNPRGAAMTKAEGKRLGKLDIETIAEQIKEKNAVVPNLIDLGYTQHNADDSRSYGIRNYGSYKDQILSVAKHVQNAANRNSTFNNFLNRGEFEKAEQLRVEKLRSNGKVEQLSVVGGWDNSIYNSNHVNNKNLLTTVIQKQFGGDPWAALEGLNSMYGSTDPLHKMLGKDGDFAKNNVALEEAVKHHINVWQNEKKSYDGEPADILVNLAKNGYSKSGGNFWANGVASIYNRYSGKESLPVVATFTTADTHGQPSTLNTTNMTPGSFSYPGTGSTVWVFFREGDPLYPVYFAASYDSVQWSSAYQKDSRPETDGNLSNQGGSAKDTTINVGPLAVRSASTSNTADPSGSRNTNSAILSHPSGNSITLARGLLETRASSDCRTHIENNEWHNVYGNKTDFVKQNRTLVVHGKNIEIIGDINPVALQALTKLAKKSLDINKMFCSNEQDCPPKK